jgi:hypothetical protein
MEKKNVTLKESLLGKYAPIIPSAWNNPFIKIRKLLGFKLSEEGLNSF